MKIALLSPVAFLPATQGNTARILALAQAIRAQGHEVWIVLLCDPPDRAPYEALFGADRVVTIPAAPRIQHFIWRLALWLRRQAGHLLHLPGRHYRRLDDLYQPHWTPHLRALQRETAFDAVCCTYVYTSAALDIFPDHVLKLVDTHDAFTEAHRSYLACGIKRFFYSLRAGDETRGFRRADAVLAIQEAEADAFRRQIGTHPDNPDIVTVSHLVLQNAEPVPDHSLHRALFLGSGNDANVQGARDFITGVLPRVLAQLPDFRLVLAGRVCAAVPDHPAVIKLGCVDDLATAFAAAPMLVNPVAMDTGINIKLLDAMAAGVPVISTRMGLRGLPEAYRGFVQPVPDGDPQAFADRIVALIPDMATRAALSATAQEHVAAWNAAQTAGLAQALATASKRPAAPPAPAAWQPQPR